MDAIRKKMLAMKLEKDNALDKCCIPAVSLMTPLLRPVPTTAPDYYLLFDSFLFDSNPLAQIWIDDVTYGTRV